MKYRSVDETCCKCNEYINGKCKGLLVYDYRDCDYWKGYVDKPY